MSLKESVMEVKEAMFGVASVSVILSNINTILAVTVAIANLWYIWWKVKNNKRD